MRHTSGPAAPQLAAEPHGRPALWFHRVNRPTLVLGSNQSDELIADPGEWTVTRRRSGGGVVVLTPDNSVWVDVIVPRGHPRFLTDVVRAFDWLGLAWRDVVAQLAPGITSDVSRPLENQPQNRSDYCFGALGVGEVTLGDHKVVGLSQRRTRDHSRFQCQLLLSDPRTNDDLWRAAGPSLTTAIEAGPPAGWPSGLVAPTVDEATPVVEAVLHRHLNQGLPANNSDSHHPVH